MSNINVIQDETKTVCFVNSDERPEKVVLKEVYKYRTDPFTKKITFWQLVEKFYLHEDEQSEPMVYHSLYDWERISIRKEYQASVKGIIDASEGIRAMKM